MRRSVVSILFVVLAVSEIHALDDLDARIALLQAENATLKKLTKIEALERENAELKKKLGTGAAATPIAPATPTAVQVASTAPFIPAPIAVVSEPNPRLQQSSYRMSEVAYSPAATEPRSTTSRPSVPTATYASGSSIRSENRWSGAYVGTFIGFGWGNWNISDRSEYSYFSPGCSSCIPPIPDSTLTTIISGASMLSPVAPVGGIEAGFLAQYGTLALGAEADITLGSIRQSKIDTLTVSATSNPPIGSDIRQTYPGSFEASLEWSSTLRGRAGVSFGDLLLTGTGGVSFAQVDIRSPTIDLTTTKYAVGYAAGAGAQYAIGSNLSLRLDYLYLGFPDQTVTVTRPAFFPGGSPQTSTATLSPSTHIVRAGIDWRFN